MPDEAPVMLFLNLIFSLIIRSILQNSKKNYQLQLMEKKLRLHLKQFHRYKNFFQACKFQTWRPELWNKDHNWKRPGAGRRNKFNCRVDHRKPFCAFALCSRYSKCRIRTWWYRRNDSCNYQPAIDGNRYQIFYQVRSCYSIYAEVMKAAWHYAVINSILKKVIRYI
jgi:hypothetical protein